MGIIQFMSISYLLRKRGKRLKKNVFGVLGMPTSQNSRNARLVVDSLSEGAILVF